jgi:delta 1-pyrroline-5-carboxylate dehydrogenase
MPTTLSATTFNNFIDGKWSPASSGETFENRNPANTSDLIGLFQHSRRQDVEAALAAASKSGGWSPPPAGPSFSSRRRSCSSSAKSNSPGT